MRIKKNNIMLKQAKLSYSILAISLFLGACTLAPNYQRPVIQSNIPLPVVDKEVQLKAYQIGWKNYFKDARLKQLIEIGLKNNSDIRLALLTLQENETKYGLNIYNLFPQLSAGNVTKNRTGPLKNETQRAVITQSYNAGLGVTNFEIDLYGKLRDKGKMARHTLFASQYAKQATEIMLISSIAKAYYDVKVTAELLQNNQQSLKYQEEIYKFAELRYNAGLISGIDLLDFQTGLETVKANIIEITLKYANSVNNLAILIGQPIPENLPIGNSLNNQFNYAIFPRDIPSEVLLYRPDVRQAEEILKASYANIGVARAAFFPSINLTGNIQASSASFNQLFKASSMGWGAGPSISIPIFDIYPNTVNLKLSKIEKEKNLINYETTIQNAFFEIITALNTNDALQKNYDSLNRIKNNEEKKRNLVRMRFNQGIDDRNDIIKSEQSFLTSKNQLLNKQNMLLNNQVDLYKALGGGANEYNIKLNDDKTKQKE